MPKTAIIATQAEEPTTLNRGVPEESAARAVSVSSGRRALRRDEEWKQ